MPSTQSIAAEPSAKPSRKIAPERSATLRFWGVRGSTPTVDKATWRYGGNTACVELTTPAGARVILDCGTGLRMLGRHLEATQETEKHEPHIFVTHYHWDHIQGLPFFSPLYVEKNQFQFYSFRSKFLGRDSLRQVFETPGLAERMGASAREGISRWSFEEDVVGLRVAVAALTKKIEA